MVFIYSLKVYVRTVIQFHVCYRIQFHMLQPPRSGGQTGRSRLRCFAMASKVRIISLSWLLNQNDEQQTVSEDPADSGLFSCSLPELEHDLRPQTPGRTEVWTQQGTGSDRRGHHERIWPDDEEEAEELGGISAGRPSVRLPEGRGETRHFR